MTKPTEIAALPIETCPRDPDVPYVLLHKSDTPVVAEWQPEGFTEPCWDLWLGGNHYGLGLPEEDVIGWYPVSRPS